MYSSSAVWHGAESNVVRRDAGCPRSTAVPDRRYASGGAHLPSSSGGPLCDGDGFMAATYYSEDPGTSATGDMQRLHVMQRLLPRCSEPVAKCTVSSLFTVYWTLISDHIPCSFRVLACCLCYLCWSCY